MAAGNQKDNIKSALNYVVNILHCLTGVALGLIARYALHHETTPLANRVSWFAAAYLLFLLLAASARSDGWGWTWYILPSRTPALVSFVGVLFAIVLSFAQMYRSEDVSSAAPVYQQRCLPPQPCIWVPFQADEKDRRADALKDELDAVYFSTVTLTTVGYGDFTARSASARHLVVRELFTGLLMLILAFPLLICRIAVFEEAEDRKGKTGCLGKGSTPHAANP